MNEFCLVLLTVYQHSPPFRPYIDSLHHNLHLWSCLFQLVSRNFNFSVVSDFVYSYVILIILFFLKIILEEFEDITDPCWSPCSTHFWFGPSVPCTCSCISLLFMKPSKRLKYFFVTSFPHYLTAKSFFHTES